VNLIQRDWDKTNSEPPIYLNMHNWRLLRGGRLLVMVPIVVFLDYAHDRRAEFIIAGWDRYFGKFLES
jgi:hypothetical protein